MNTPRDRAFETSPMTPVDCSCKAIVYQDGSGIEIEYCPLHWAAPDLLAACENARIQLAGCAQEYADLNALRQIAVAIQKAKGER